jgi:hypothetical protein
VEFIKQHAETLCVPDRIVVALVAELTLYGILAQSAPIPELLRKLEKGYTTLLVR